MVVPQDDTSDTHAGRTSLFSPPRELTLAAVLLVLSAIPWFVVYLDNTIAGSSTAGATAHGSTNGVAGAMLLLNIVFIVLAVRVRSGRRATRTKVLAMTLSFDLILLMTLSGLTRFGGAPAGEATFVVTVSVFTLVVSITGALLLLSRPSRTYVDESEAGMRARLDRANARRASS